MESFALDEKHGGSVWLVRIAEDGSEVARWFLHTEEACALRDLLWREYDPFGATWQPMTAERVADMARSPIERTNHCTMVDDKKAKR